MSYAMAKTVFRCLHLPHNLTFTSLQRDPRLIDWIFGWYVGCIQFFYRVVIQTWMHFTKENKRSLCLVMCLFKNMYFFSRAEICRIVQLIYDLMESYPSIQRLLGVSHLIICGFIVSHVESCYRWNSPRLMQLLNMISRHANIDQMSQGRCKYQSSANFKVHLPRYVILEDKLPQ